MNVTVKTHSIDVYSKNSVLRSLQMRLFRHTIEDELPHNHDYFECVYIEKGHGYHIVNNQKLPIKEGDYLIIDCNTTHDYEAQNGELSVINLLFCPEFIDRTLSHCKDFYTMLNHYLFKLDISSAVFNFSNVVFHDDERRIYKLFTLMLDEYENKNTAYKEIIRCYIIEFLLHTLRSLNIFTKQNISHTVAAVLDYIEKNYAEEIALADICNEINYSLPYVSKKIKDETGLTFIQHLQNTRINQACCLLANTRKSIQEICTLSGYNDIKHFNSIFKKHIGISPSVYRKNL